MALATYFSNVIDQNGNAVAGASVTVQNVVAGTAVANPLPTIYTTASADAGSPTQQANPLLTDANGNYSFAAPDGAYQIVISGSNIPTQTLTIVKMVAAAATGAGSGTVTSVALSIPASIFTLGGSPVVGAGTLAVGLQTQAKNLVWAGPTAGVNATPTFRALVNADLPTSGVTAAAYGSVVGSTINVPTITVNAQGVVTAGTTTAIVVAKTSVANNWTGAQNVNAVSIAYSATITTDASTSNIFNVGALTGNLTLANPTNLVNGGNYQWNLTQDGVGNRLITYGALFKFPSGSSSALSTAANATDTLICSYDGSILRCTLLKGYT